MLTPFPKIFALGTVYIRNIFTEEVEITEKVDGSQFVWMVDSDGTLHMRSKGATLYAENPRQMFRAGIEYLQSIKDSIPRGIIFFGEYLRAPKHTVLKYDRHPQNHIALFGAMYPGGEVIRDWEKYAPAMGIDAVPILYRGQVTDPTGMVENFLMRESYLGGQLIEGVVAKNYDRQFLLDGQPMPLMAGKYVSEAFKEVAKKTWGKEHTSRGKWDLYKDSFRTPARWHKAVQHLQESGQLTATPRDIGSLIKEVHRDITDEEKESIKEFLWKEFGREVLATSTKGLPEWYKKELLDEGVLVLQD